MYHGEKQIGQGYGGGAAMVGGSVAAFANEAKREIEIPAQVMRLTSRIDHAHDSLRELASRLDPLMRPQPPETAAAGQLSAVGPSTQCGAELSALVGRVEALTERMQDMLRRLEV